MLKNTITAFALLALACSSSATTRNVRPGDGGAADGAVQAGFGQGCDEAAGEPGICPNLEGVSGEAVRQECQQNALGWHVCSFRCDERQDADAYSFAPGGFGLALCGSLGGSCTLVATEFATGWGVIDRFWCEPAGR